MIFQIEIFAKIFELRYERAAWCGRERERASREKNYQSTINQSIDNMCRVRDISIRIQSLSYFSIRFIYDKY